MREATIQRPITIPKLAEAVRIKPYQVLAQLIPRAIFPYPTEAMDDKIACEVAATFAVEVRIVDDYDDGPPDSAPKPTNPKPPILPSGISGTNQGGGGNSAALRASP